MAWFTHRRYLVLVALVAAFSIAIIAGRSDSRSVAKEPYKQVQLLLSTQRTILDQPIAYPKTAGAKVTAAVVTLLPGEATGWHKHNVPLFGYMLQGELTVDYGPHGKRVYKTGDSLMEAINAAHDGRNTGAGPMRILAVFMGADGVANTVKLPAAPAQPR